MPKSSSILCCIYCDQIVNKRVTAAVMAALLVLISSFTYKEIASL
jgi:hypothetical protein